MIQWIEYNHPMLTGTTTDLVQRILSIDVTNTEKYVRCEFMDTTLLIEVYSKQPK